MNLVWYSLARQELPSMLMGEQSIAIGKREPNLTAPDVALSFCSDTGGIAVPALALVGHARKELFSWLSTYAEAAFPLSQYCRVCSVEDWTELNLHSKKESYIGSVHPIWMSLILGEMLGQADADPDVAGAPLARATACFSFSMARTRLLYDKHGKAMSICIDRLAKAESEPRFSRRQITVSTLKKIWSIVNLLESVPSLSNNFLDTVRQVVKAVNPHAATLLSSVRFLESDSAEDRVVGFDSFVDTLFGMRHSESIGPEGTAVALAAAAILAGRGTSHIQLLVPSAKKYPETLVWFGLLAGVLGPRSWDKAWSQQSKGIERALRQFFSLEEPVAADLCWAEYEWLSQTYTASEVFNALPKSAARSLSIEMLPGVNCLFRLGASTSSSRNTDEKRINELEEKRQSALIANNVLLNSIELLEHVQKLLHSQLSGGQGQKSLFATESVTKQGRAGRRRSTDKLDKPSN